MGSPESVPKRIRRPFFAERSKNLGGGLAADGVDGEFHAATRGDLPDLFVDRAVGRGDHGVAAELFELLYGLAAANDVECFESVMVAELDDHPSEVRAGGGLEQPLTPGHGEDVANDREHGGGVDEEGGDLVVGDIGGNRAGPGARE